MVDQLQILYLEKPHFLAGSFTNLSSLQGNGNVALLFPFVLYRLDDAAVLLFPMLIF